MPNEQDAARDVRDGAVQGAVILPPGFSRRVYAGEQPHVGLLLDNTDAVVSGTLQGLLDAARCSRRSATSRRRGWSRRSRSIRSSCFRSCRTCATCCPGVITLGHVHDRDDRRRRCRISTTSSAACTKAISSRRSRSSSSCSGRTSPARSRPSSRGTMVAIVGALVAGVYDDLQPAALSRAPRC